MKCPLCGAQIKEGSLYCESCGEDIHIVPDFDPTVEDACRQTIESMTEGIFGPKNVSDKKQKAVKQNSDKSDLSEIDQNANDNKSDEHGRKKNAAKLPVLLFSVAIFVLIVISVFVYYAIYFSSDKYRYSQAEKAFLAGDYEKAESIYSDLLAANRFDSGLMDKYATCLYYQGKNAEYEEILLRIVDNYDSTEAQKLGAYSSLVNLYSDEGEVDKIIDLINTSNDDQVLNLFNDYLVSAPSFSLEQGEYDTPQYLYIESESDCGIYYSINYIVDGETSIMASNLKYDGPIYLYKGAYEISAYCQTANNIKSDISSVYVNITITPPSAPTIKNETGYYSAPVFLELESFDSDNLDVFYSTDGTKPDKNSKKYDGKILLLPGEYYYSFIAYDRVYDIYSEAETIKLIIECECNYLPEDCSNLLLDYMYENGLVKDVYGYIDDVGNHIRFDFTDVEIREDEYVFVFKEMLINADAESQYLNVCYTVNPVSGEISKVTETND